MHIMHTVRVSCAASKARPTTSSLMRDAACVTHTHAATPRRLTHMHGLYLNWFPPRRPLDPTFVCAPVAGSPDSSASFSARLQLEKDWSVHVCVSQKKKEKKTTLLVCDPRQRCTKERNVFKKSSFS